MRDQAKKDYDRAYYLANRDRIIAQTRAYAKANQEKVKANTRAYYLANREIIKARATAWAKAHPERMQQKNREWLARNPDYRRKKRRDSKLRRRAAKKGLLGIERVRRTDIWARDEGICHICGLACDPNDWHLDHIIPLSKGGVHSPANVAVSHPECNIRKGNK